MNKLIESVIEFLMRWCEKRGRVLKITGTAGPEDTYLIRYILLRTRYLSVYIHQFLRSDRDDLHDHPWHFATFLVRGAYTENKYNFKTKQVEKTRRVAKSSVDHSEVSHFLETGIGNGSSRQNRLVFRKATDQHQVVVDRDLKPSEKDQAALTFFVGGPVIREWGFIKDTPKDPFHLMLSKYEVELFAPGTPVKPTYRKWIDWRSYLGLPPDHPSR